MMNSFAKFEHARVSREIEVRFYAELNDFLPPEKRQRAFNYVFTGTPSYKRPARTVQRALGLRELTHHALGRHSVASQAVTNGHTIKAVQAQLGHRSEQSTHTYAHLGSGAQRRLVESLRPVAPPHGTHRAPSKKKGT